MLAKQALHLWKYVLFLPVAISTVCCIFNFALFICQAFLGMFVDDSVTGGNVRRRSTTEDDNPPSPVLDNIDVFNIAPSHQSTGSPGQRQRTDVSVYVAVLLVTSCVILGFSVWNGIAFSLWKRQRFSPNFVCCKITYSGWMLCLGGCFKWWLYVCQLQDWVKRGHCCLQCLRLGISVQSHLLSTLSLMVWIQVFYSWLSNAGGTITFDFHRHSVTEYHPSRRIPWEPSASCPLPRVICPCPLTKFPGYTHAVSSQLFYQPSR